MGNVIFLLILFGGMWAILIRPQQKRVKAHQALIAKASAGDRVHLSSGIYGTITEVLDITMYVEIAEGIEILVARSQISDILEEFPTESTADGDADADADVDDDAAAEEEA
ncbi:MAG: preprotein translocase subunit YajC [Acidimicrobiales bacterium]